MDEMTRYLIARVSHMLIALCAMSAVVFALGRWTGDPVALLLGDYASEQDRQQLVERLGLHRPWSAQYAIFVGQALRGDLGRSLTGDQRPALEVVAERLPASLQLAAAALLFSLSLGVPLGVMAAVHAGSWLDRTARLAALLGQSVPAFWLGIVLMSVFSVQLGWLPTSGYGQPRHLVLPALSMGMFTIAAIIRLVRVAMREALASEYVKLARIKGLSEAKVIGKHALRNSLIPVVTYMGPFFATMITGAVVIETVFSWPGVGRLAYESILNRDFPVMQALVLVMSALFMLANLGVDALYFALDPRIRR
jgi:peptide/nickel transport system permease protein